MSNLHTQHFKVNKLERQKKFGHLSPVIWFTGLSGSGKSTLANALESKLFDSGYKTYVLDGDNIRMGLNKDLDFSNKDRKENIRRIAEVANLFSDSGTITLTAFISPFEQDRQIAKSIIGDNFIEVFVSANIETCEMRDPKGLYKKARAGEIKNFTGLDSPYEVPKNPDIVVESDKLDVEESTELIISYLKNKFI